MFVDVPLLLYCTCVLSVCYVPPADFFGICGSYAEAANLSRCEFRKLYPVFADEIVHSNVCVFIM